MRLRVLPVVACIVAMLGSDALAQSIPAGCMDAAEKDVRARHEQPMAERVLPCTAAANGGKACTPQDRIIEVDISRGAGQATHIYICNFPTVRLLSTR
jgi:hypothetical protein